MRPFVCDICGETFDPKKQWGSLRSDASNPYAGELGVVSLGLDVCGVCALLGEKMNFHRICLDAWREARKTGKVVS